MRLKRVLYGIDWKQPLISFAYTILIVAAAFWIYRLSMPIVQANQYAVIFFAGLVAAAECMHVRLPHANGFVSVGSAICLAAVVCLGPANAAVASSLGIAAANIFVAAIPLDAALFNAGQLAITSYVSGLVLTVAGGVPGAPIIIPRDLLPLLLAMASYTFLNTTLVTIGIALAARKPIWKTWLASMRWTVPNYIGLGPLGLLAAVIYHSSLQMYGILLLWIPLLFARYSFQQYWEIRRAHIKTIEALAVALDARDPYTSGHSERVSHYAGTMAAHAKLPDTEVEQIRFAGILHDIGKIGISDFILNKKGALDAEEYALIQSHPGIGADMIKNIGFLDQVGVYIRHHHERYDGTGYPDKLQGDQIPLGARIIGVADAFDAMTCDRVYRPGMSPEEAISRLKSGRGTQFDAEMVDCFIEVWETVFDNGRQAPLPARKRNEQEPAASSGPVQDHTTA